MALVLPARIAIFPRWDRPPATAQRIGRTLVQIDDNVVKQLGTTSPEFPQILDSRKEKPLHCSKYRSCATHGACRWGGPAASGGSAGEIIAAVAVLDVAKFSASQQKAVTGWYRYHCALKTRICEWNGAAPVRATSRCVAPLDIAYLETIA